MSKRVVTSSEMKEIESFDYAHGVKEEDFMERVGELIAKELPTGIPILFLVGKGNNGGDAFVAARYLKQRGEKVYVKCLHAKEAGSTLNQKMRTCYEECGGEYLNKLSSFEEGVLVDALLGTGFHGELKQELIELIEEAQKLHLPMISIDIPSGVNGTTGEVALGAVVATHTFFLGLPKWGCFLGKAWEHTGNFSVLDFGLSEEALSEGQIRAYVYDHFDATNDLPLLHRTRHKYQAGFVVGIGGSPGMPGAPLLASKAALHSGAGIVHLLHPEEMALEFSAAPLELVRKSYSYKDVQKIKESITRASSIFIGPGFGLGQQQRNFLKELLPHIHHPVVIDADALTLLSTMTITYPKDSILTPHFGEMRRLLAIEEELSLEQILMKVQEFVDSRKVTVVLKGAPTFVFYPFEAPFVVPYGDPGMATAGSGDVLTGIIAALLAQGIEPFRAALLGVYIHAKAGEHAAESLTSYCMTASSIIEELPSSFFDLYHAIN